METPCRLLLPCGMVVAGGLPGRKAGRADAAVARQYAIRLWLYLDQFVMPGCGSIRLIRQAGERSAGLSLEGNTVKRATGGGLENHLAGALNFRDHPRRQGPSCEQEGSPRGQQGPPFPRHVPPPVERHLGSGRLRGGGRDRKSVV